MNRYRTSLLMKQFPFLNRLFIDVEGYDAIPLENVGSIFVARANEELLARTGCRESYSYDAASHNDYRIYFAVWNELEGERIVPLAASVRDASGRKQAVETIGEELFSQNAWPDYLVECIQTKTVNNDQSAEVDNVWTVFPMKKPTILRYHERQIDLAAAALKTELIVD